MGYDPAFMNTAYCTVRVRLPLLMEKREFCTIEVTLSKSWRRKVLDSRVYSRPPDPRTYYGNGWEKSEGSRGY